MHAYRISSETNQEEALSTLLWEAGTLGTQVLQEPDGRLAVVAYFSEDATERLSRALGRLSPPARLDEVPIPDVDWLARFRERFRSFRIGGFLVVPAWEAAPVEPGVHCLRLDPGHAFGTGTHESTRLALRALEARAGRSLGRVLDVGTGSGILAVAAALLSAEEVVAVELDPDALDVARRHRVLNQARVHLVRGDGAGSLRPARFDLVIANLSLALLLERRGELLAARAPGGLLVASGFLSEELPAMREAYAGRDPLEELREGDWAALVVGR